MDTQQELFQYLLRQGDTNLILGHRLSEMCSRAPMLEEDIALTNIALAISLDPGFLSKLVKCRFKHDYVT